MSQQLTISSLASALALVCLCLFARAGAGDAALHLDKTGPIAHVESTATDAG